MDGLASPLRDFIARLNNSGKAKAHSAVCAYDQQSVAEARCQHCSLNFCWDCGLLLHRHPMLAHHSLVDLDGRVVQRHASAAPLSGPVDSEKRKERKKKRTSLFDPLKKTTVSKAQSASSSPRLRRRKVEEGKDKSPGCAASSEILPTGVVTNPIYHRFIPVGSPQKEPQNPKKMCLSTSPESSDSEKKSPTTREVAQNNGTRLSTSHQENGVKIFSRELPRPMPGRRAGNLQILSKSADADNAGLTPSASKRIFQDKITRQDLTASAVDLKEAVDQENSNEGSDWCVRTVDEYTAGIFETDDSEISACELTPRGVAIGRSSHNVADSEAHVPEVAEWDEKDDTQEKFRLRRGRSSSDLLPVSSLPSFSVASKIFSEVAKWAGHVEEDGVSRGVTETKEEKAGSPKIPKTSPKGSKGSPKDSSTSDTKSPSGVRKILGGTPPVGQRKKLFSLDPVKPSNGKQGMSATRRRRQSNGSIKDFKNPIYHRFVPNRPNSVLS